jgi:hypothetical protein
MVMVCRLCNAQRFVDGRENGRQLSAFEFMMPFIVTGLPAASPVITRHRTSSGMASGRGNKEIKRIII